MNLIILSIVIVLALVGAGGIIYGYYCRRTMSALDSMVEKAIDGTFVPEHYDERRLSRLENKLSHFLSAGALSRNTIEADRNRIKTLIGDISHQTKTPIANITMYAQLLEEQEKDPALQPLVKEIVNQGQKLSFLIQSLVKLSRLEGGVLNLDSAINDLGEMINAAAADYITAAEEKNITLTIEPPSKLKAGFDKKWTVEALGNLIDNAIKYTPPGGSVKVSAREYKLFCRIDVADTGPGIEENEYGQIFHRFYRGKAGADLPGVGVGLYLVRQIATAQGGYVRVHSQPGQGSVFSMYLPKTPGVPSPEK